MLIRLLETIQYRSERLDAGAILDLPDAEAKQLVDAGHAEPEQAVKTAKPSKES